MNTFSVSLTDPKHFGLCSYRSDETIHIDLLYIVKTELKACTVVFIFLLLPLTHADLSQKVFSALTLSKPIHHLLNIKH